MPVPQSRAEWHRLAADLRYSTDHAPWPGRRADSSQNHQVRARQSTPTKPPPEVLALTLALLTLIALVHTAIADANTSWSAHRPPSVTTDSEQLAGGGSERRDGRLGGTEASRGGIRRGVSRADLGAKGAPGQAVT